MRGKNARSCWSSFRERLSVTGQGWLNTSILAGFTARLTWNWKRFDSQICDKRRALDIAHDGPYATHRIHWKLLWYFRRNWKVACWVVAWNIYSWFFMRSVLYWRGYWCRKYFTFRGQYAVVKQCREKATGKEFAAKFVRKRRKGKDCRPEVWHEVEVLNATNYPHQHPQIITLYDVFETRSEIILILELWVFFFSALF